jgi:hypothetical protein
METRLIFRDHRNTIKTDGGTQWTGSGAQWFQSGVSSRLGEVNPPGRLPGKSSKECEVSVPQTDTGGREEYSKALG